MHIISLLAILTLTVVLSFSQPPYWGGGGGPWWAYYPRHHHHHHHHPHGNFKRLQLFTNFRKLRLEFLNSQTTIFKISVNRSGLGSLRSE